MQLFSTDSSICNQQRWHHQLPSASAFCCVQACCKHTEGVSCRHRFDSIVGKCTKQLLCPIFSRRWENDPANDKQCPAASAPSEKAEIRSNGAGGGKPKATAVDAILRGNFDCVDDCPAKERRRIAKWQWKSPDSHLQQSDNDGEKLWWSDKEAVYKLQVSWVWG